MKFVNCFLLLCLCISSLSPTIKVGVERDACTTTVIEIDSTKKLPQVLLSADSASCAFEEYCACHVVGMVNDTCCIYYIVHTEHVRERITQLETGIRDYQDNIETQQPLLEYEGLIAKKAELRASLKTLQEYSNVKIFGSKNKGICCTNHKQYSQMANAMHAIANTHDITAPTSVKPKDYDANPQHHLSQLSNWKDRAIVHIQRAVQVTSKDISLLELKCRDIRAQNLPSVDTLQEQVKSNQRFCRELEELVISQDILDQQLEREVEQAIQLIGDKDRLKEIEMISEAFFKYYCTQACAEEMPSSVDALMCFDTVRKTELSGRKMLMPNWLAKLLNNYYANINRSRLGGNAFNEIAIATNFTPVLYTTRVLSEFYITKQNIKQIPQKLRKRDTVSKLFEYTEGRLENHLAPNLQPPSASPQHQPTSAQHQTSA